MLDLLKNYSLRDIIIFIFMLALAIKWLVDFYDWAKIRIKKLTNEEQSAEELHQKMLDTLASHNEQINKMAKLINILIKSDRDDIKAWITEKHHYFCYDLGYIDDYNLQCVEARYKHYKEENGNTFIDELMKDIRALPIVSAIHKKEEDK